MSNAVSTLRASFSPLRYPNFRLYLGGQAVSLIGTWMQSTAQGWVVNQLSNRSEGALATVVALNTLPILLLSPFAGVWADRVDRRRLLIVTQIVAMLLAFILAVLTQTGLVQLWHVYILSFMLGIVNALDLPAQQAFLGDLSGMGEIRKAVNLNAMILQVSRILGPALAGIIVARIDIPPVFWLNGVSFLVVIASLILVRASQASSSRGDGENPLQQFMDGLRFLRTQPRMVDLFIFATLVVFMVLSIVMSQLPAYATKILNGNAETLGALMSSSGAGALIGVLFVIPFFQARKRSGIALGAAAVWMSLCLAAFAFAPQVASVTTNPLIPLILASISLFFGSMAAPSVIATALGLVQFMSPVAMRGRLLSLFSWVTFGWQFIAVLLVGYLAERLGLQTVILLNAVVLFTGASLMLIFRTELRRWEMKPATQSPAPATDAVGD